MRRFIFLLTMMSIPSLAFAGGWTQKKGGYYAKFSLNNFSTREQFNLAGNREALNNQFSLRDAKFTDTNFGFYGELGVLEGLTLIANTSFKNYNSTGFNTLTQQNFDNSASGLGDLYVGGRLRLLTLPFVLALQPMVKLPAGSKDKTIPLGSGQADAELRLQMGVAIPIKIQNYFTADIGYTSRGGAEFNDEIPYFAEFGIFPVRDLIVKAQIDGRKSTASITSPMRAGQSNQNVLIVNQDFTRLWGGIIYSTSPTTQVSLEFSSTISGKNTVAGRAVYFGLAFKTP